MSCEALEMSLLKLLYIYLLIPSGFSIPNTARHT